MKQVIRLMRVMPALLVLVLALAMPSSASAVEAYAAGHGFGCPGSYGGGFDRNFRLYLPCGNYVLRIETNGAHTYFPSNLAPGAIGMAPSPDGNHIYVIRHDGLYRANLANGAYNWDPNWVPERLDARYAACGRGVSTDAYGYIYISNGGWCTGPNQVAKYRPNGTIVTRFGDFGAQAGQFNVDMDVTVTSDGRRIYVADHLNTRVQYFDWQWDGSYRYAGAFAVPSANYGVKLDPWGYVYVADTTQARIWKHDRDGNRLALVTDEPDGNRIHNISVDARGWVYSGEMQKAYPRRWDNPVPGPLPAHNPEPRTDTRDPNLTSVTAPAETTDPGVRVTIAATDPDGNAIVAMRLADENGTWGAWRAYATAFDVTFTSGLGTKATYVQVRDAAGRESNVRAATTIRRPIPDVADPVVTVSAPASTTSSAISLAIQASDDIGVTHLRVAGEDGEFSEWKPWASGSATLPHTLTSGLGTRIVAIQVRDAAFKVSATAQATIAVVAPPVVEDRTGGGVIGGGEVLLPNGERDRTAPTIRVFRMPARSCSRRIVLVLTASDNLRTVQVRVANEDGRYGAWRAFRPRLVHFLSRGTTRKAVYVQVRDAAGNVSSTKVRRTIVQRCVRRR